MQRIRRYVILASADAVATVLAGLLAFVIRYAVDGRAIPAGPLRVFLTALPVIIPLRIIVYYALGLYRQMWSHASIAELARIVWAVFVETVISALVIWTMPHDGFPRSVFPIGGLLEVAALGTIRLALRFRRELLSVKTQKKAYKHRMLIFGAGDAGALLARELQRHPELSGVVVGFIDDDPAKRGLYIAGVPVLGNRSTLEEQVKKFGVTHLLIAMPSVRGAVIREVVEVGRKLGLHLKTVPGLFELINGRVSVTEIRDVQIEDVLGRDEVKVDLEAIAEYLGGETVLVTGAGGSIGSELCRQVARFGPSQLLLLGHGENSIYEIDLELRGKFPDLSILPIIADVQDEARIRRVFETYRPGVVFHAAAHKHVPLMECNPGEAIKNNIFGTFNVAHAADIYRAKRFVLISSDKAVNPTSVMGATKRAAEFVVQSMARTSTTVFVAVRFGNVLGSRGSVIPLFKKQIAAGGPVTITDHRMIRYFMTIPEASQLVIQAASMGKGGEVFVLDMGKPVRIIDLARDLIRLSGFEPDVEIPIKCTGIRPGEKLFEELLTAEEGTWATIHERIYVARTVPIARSAIETLITNLQHLERSPDLSPQSLLATINEVQKNAKDHQAAGVGD